MPPKKAVSTKFLVRANAEGEWTQGEGDRGEFRVFVDTDLAQVSINVGPGYLEDWNPITLRSYSMRYLRGGGHLRISFEFLPLQWKGELELNVSGGFAGKFEGPNGPGKINGTGTVQEARDHVHEIPKPTQALAQKLQNEPAAVRWEVPACVRDELVLLVGIGGASKSGKSVLAGAVAARLRDEGREVAIVEQSRYEQCVGSYNCSAGVHESMYENPSAYNWPDFVRGISKAAESIAPSGTLDDAQARPVVIVEGPLVFWMPQVREAMHRRIFVRASRKEILRRRQASATLAEPFVEHVFWPMHLQYGQPQAPWDELRVEDDEEGFPAPEALVSEALGILRGGAGPAAVAAEPAANATPGDQPAEAPAAAAE